MPKSRRRKSRRTDQHGKPIGAYTKVLLHKAGDARCDYHGNPMFKTDGSPKLYTSNVYRVIRNKIPIYAKNDIIIYRKIMKKIPIPHKPVIHEHSVGESYVKVVSKREIMRTIKKGEIIKETIPKRTIRTTGLN